jgi:hypothetical protein
MSNLKSRIISQIAAYGRFVDTYPVIRFASHHGR